MLLCKIHLLISLGKEVYFVFINKAPSIIYFSVVGNARNCPGDKAPWPSMIFVFQKLFVSSNTADATSPLGPVIPIRVCRLVRRIKGQWPGHRCLQWETIYVASKGSGYAGAFQMWSSRAGLGLIWDQSIKWVLAMILSFVIESYPWVIYRWECSVECQYRWNSVYSNCRTPTKCHLV